MEQSRKWGGAQEVAAGAGLAPAASLSRSRDYSQNAPVPPDEMLP